MIDDERMTDPASTLPGLDAHPHARAVLTPGLPPAGHPSHAYLFHGPSGTGKRTVARAFAAALLADGAADAAAVSARVMRGAHPDLTWVLPSGALEMLVGDVDEAVVASVARTPFESRRRVFVIEAAHTMNDQVANRLLKTLEEPPPFAHIVLLAQRLHDVLPTVASRCQHVRFDPLPHEVIERRLQDEAPAADAEQLRACARLAQGDARLARRLAGEQGGALRASTERLVRGALHGRTDERQWLEVLEQAKTAGTLAGAELLQQVQSELELMPVKERRRHVREATDAQRRLERRERTGTLDVALRLCELWLRDVWLVAEGTPELVYAVDRLTELGEDAAGRSPMRLRQAVELVAQTRRRLQVNVAEELALETLAYRLELLLGVSAP
jgi:DNA polymerase-3 subunit delta'